MGSTMKRWFHIIKNGYQRKMMAHMFQTINVKVSSRQRFGLKIVGYFVDEWLEMICAKFCFYHLATFVWKQYHMDDESLKWHQSTLINKVFGIQNVADFIWRKNNPQYVPTWDKSSRIMMDKDQVVSVHKEACIFGPLAARFG